ncbi:MAG: nitroreductase family protein [Candidatus Hodarchaeota archaeon]
MNIEDIIYRRRTIRRFKQEPISLDTLKKLIDFARVAPMARNVQALEFIIVENAEVREKLFPLVSWAGSLPADQRTPENGREPTGYIIVLVNTKIKKVYVDFDVGAAVENILLGAASFGIGTCWMGAINFKKIRELFEIPEHYDIKQVISLGYPDEESVMETYKDSFTYWKDSNGKMHVPKRELDDIILKTY